MRYQAARRLLAITLPAVLCIAAAAGATHTPGGCSDCTSHRYWPMIDGVTKRAEGARVTYRGTSRSDELLGHHGSDTILGRDSNDVLWADWDPSGQPSAQHDLIYGGAGTDFIYGSHGRNTIYAGTGNDVVSVHYGRGLVDCGPGRDIPRRAHAPQELPLPELRESGLSR